MISKEIHDKNIKEDLEALIRWELNFSKNYHEKSFGRMQYGYGVLLEELEETVEEVLTIEDGVNYIWNSIKANNLNEAKERLEKLEGYCLMALQELVQLTAMVKKVGECDEI